MDLADCLASIPVRAEQAKALEAMEKQLKKALKDTENAQRKVKTANLVRTPLPDAELASVRGDCQRLGDYAVRGYDRGDTSSEARLVRQIEKDVLAKCDSARAAAARTPAADWTDQYRRHQAIPAELRSAERAALEAAEGALFQLCLETNRLSAFDAAHSGPAGRLKDDRAGRVLYEGRCAADPHNRWYDKSFGIIVFARTERRPQAVTKHYQNNISLKFRLRVWVGCWGRLSLRGTPPPARRPAWSTRAPTASR